MKGQPHYVTEVLSSLFFNLDAMAFILCYVGSLRIVLTTDDPKAPMDCPLGVGGRMWWYSLCYFTYPVVF